MRILTGQGNMSKGRRLTMVSPAFTAKRHLKGAMYRRARRNSRTVSLVVLRSLLCACTGVCPPCPRESDCAAVRRSDRLRRPPLQLKEPTVGSLLPSHELYLRAGLHDAPLTQVNDVVRQTDGREAMGDQQDRPSLAPGLEMMEQRHFGCCVQ